MAATEAYKRWYEKHKLSFNEKRRTRYANDPDHRAKIVTRTRTLRSSRSGGTGQVRTHLFIGEVSKKIGRDVQTIRAWEYRGLIPRSVNERGFRIYSQNQVQLMSQLAEFLATYVRGNEVEFKKELDKVAKYVHENWEA